MTWIGDQGAASCAGRQNPSERIVVWDDLNAAGPPRVLDGTQAEGLHALAASPQGTELAVCGERNRKGYLAILDLKTGALLRERELEEAQILLTLAVDWKGGWLAVGDASPQKPDPSGRKVSPSRAFFLDLETLTVRWTTRPYPGPVRSLALSKDGLLACGWTRTQGNLETRIDVLDAERGVQVCELSALGEPVGLAFSEAGLLYASSDGHVHLVDPPTGEERRVYRTQGGEDRSGGFLQGIGSEKLTGLGLSPRGVIYASRKKPPGETVRAWRLGDGARVDAPRQAGGVKGIAISPDGRRALLNVHPYRAELWALPAVAPD
jgi:hypothetical protein